MQLRIFLHVYFSPYLFYFLCSLSSEAFESVWKAALSRSGPECVMKAPVQKWDRIINSCIELIASI